MPTKIIVLGGSLGSQVTRLALQAGRAVTAVKRNSAKLATGELQGTAVRRADIVTASELLPRPSGRYAVSGRSRSTVLTIN